MFLVETTTNLNCWILPVCGGIHKYVALKTSNFHTEKCWVHCHYLGTKNRQIYILSLSWWMILEVPWRYTKLQYIDTTYILHPNMKESTEQVGMLWNQTTISCMWQKFYCNNISTTILILRYIWLFHIQVPLGIVEHLVGQQSMHYNAYIKWIYCVLINFEKLVTLQQHHWLTTTC